MKLVSKIFFLVFIISVILFKIYLIKDIPLRAIGNAEHDDELYITSAQSILNGNWLGKYNYKIIARPPFYPIFIAISHSVRIPLTVIHQLFYIFSCLLFLVALTGITKNVLVLSISFILLLFNPFTFDAETYFRVLRSGIHSALILGIWASLLGAYISINQKKLFIYWNILFGIYFTAFWLNREDGTFILPSIFLFIVLLIYKLFIKKMLYKIEILFIPLVLFLYITNLICFVNYNFYGLWTTSELTEKNFVSAYNAILKIQSGWQNPYIPVPKETRNKLYKVSPSFKKLQQYFEGNLGFSWAENSFDSTQIKPEMHEIGGGWFYWAFRHSVSEINPSATGFQTAQFYKQLYSEIESSCKEGKLICTNHPIGLMPELSSSHFRIILQTLYESIMLTIFLKGVNLNITPFQNLGTIDELNVFKKITLNETFPIIIASDNYSKIQQIIYDIKHIYMYTIPVCFIIFSVRFFVVLLFKRKNYIHIFQGLLLLNYISLICLISLFASTSSTTVVSPIYLSPAYPLIIIFIILGFIDFLKVFQNKTISKQALI